MSKELLKNLKDAMAACDELCAQARVAARAPGATARDLHRKALADAASSAVYVAGMSAHALAHAEAATTLEDPDPKLAAWLWASRR